jgi:hypothetical protein
MGATRAMEQDHAAPCANSGQVLHQDRSACCPFLHDIGQGDTSGVGNDERLSQGGCASMGDKSACIVGVRTIENDASRTRTGIGRGYDQ